MRIQTTFLRPGVVDEIMSPIALDGEPSLVCAVVADRIDALAARLTSGDLDPETCLSSKRERDDPVVLAARERLIEIKLGLDPVEGGAPWLANTMSGIRAVVSRDRFEDLLRSAGITRLEFAEGDDKYCLLSGPQDPLHLTIAGWLSRETGRLTRDSLNPVLFADLHYRPTPRRAPQTTSHPLKRKTDVGGVAARKAL